MRVFVTGALPLDPRALAPEGIDVEVSTLDRPLSRDEIAAGARDAEGLVSMLVDPIDAALIAQLPRLKIIANYAVGYDNVDVAAAHARGIVVTNTPDVLTDATADLTMLLLLAVARRARAAERLLRAGGFRGWAPTLLLGTELRGKTLGLFGYGRIGSAVAARARAFGMRILATTRREREGREAGSEEVRFVPLETLLRESDVVSLHAPLTPETRHVIDADAIAAMKPDAILLNTARGPLVDEAALADALARGSLGGAGLDVFEGEPAVEAALLGRDDVVLLPHVGSATIETRRAMAEIALQNCFSVLRGHAPRTPVKSAR